MALDIRSSQVSLGNSGAQSSQRWLSDSDDSWKQKRGNTLNDVTDNDSTEQECSLPTDRLNDCGTRFSATLLGTRMRNCLNQFLIRRRGYIRSRRFPSGRASILVLFLAISERFVFYGAVNDFLDLIPGLSEYKDARYSASITILLYYCVGRLFYPVGGFLADVYLGRYRVIHLSLWLYWIAFALLEIAHLLHFTGKASISSQYAITVVSYILIVLASGGFQSTLIPFGADQIEGGSSNELSSFLYWLYFTYQFAM